MRALSGFRLTRNIGDFWLALVKRECKRNYWIVWRIISSTSHRVCEFTAVWIVYTIGWSLLMSNVQVLTRMYLGLIYYAVRRHKIYIHCRLICSDVTKNSSDDQAVQEGINIVCLDFAIWGMRKSKNMTFTVSFSLVSKPMFAIKY